MKNLYSDHGLVLKRGPRTETDMGIVIFFRNIGKVNLVVKGATQINSKHRFLLEPFSEIDAHLYLPKEGTRGRLISGHGVSTHHHLRGNYEFFSLAAKCSEVVDLLIPYRAPSALVFDILRWVYQSLNESPSPKFVWPIFLLVLFKDLGYGKIGNHLELSLPQGEKEKLTKFPCPGLDLKKVEDGLMDSGKYNLLMIHLEDQLKALLPRPLKSIVLEKEIILQGETH